MKPTTPALALLLLAACATPQEPGTILDWAPVRPPPVPGTGLPRPIAPTFTPTAKPQPGPRPTRVLPQTPETRKRAGIWASDKAPPGWDEPAPQIKVLDVEIPLPPDVETRHDAWLAVQCAHIMDLGMRTNIDMQAELVRRPKDTRCIAAMAFYWCTVQLGQRARDDLDEWERDGTITSAGKRLREKLGPVETAGFAAAARECGFPVPDWTRTLYPVFDQMQHGKTPSVKQ